MCWLWFAETISAQLLPRNEIRLEAGRHWMEPMQNTAQSGDSPGLYGWRPGTYGLACSYNYRLTRSWGLGVSASLSNTPFTYVHETRYVLLGEPTYDLGPTKEGLEHHWLPGIALNSTYRTDLGQQWGGFVNFSYGWQFMPDEKTPYTEYTTIGQPRTTYLTMIRMDNYNSGGGVLPFVRLGLGVDRMFENFNRVGMELFALYSFRRDTFRSDYVLYPGTSGESTGTIEGGVSHAGLRLSYTLTYGAPKKPAHLRKAERDAME
jgi:hypothetical protein